MLIIHNGPVASTESLTDETCRSRLKESKEKMKNDYKLVCSLMIILNSLLAILLGSDNVPQR